MLKPTFIGIHSSVYNISGIRIIRSGQVEKVSDKAGSGGGPAGWRCGASSVGCSSGGTGWVREGRVIGSKTAGTCDSESAVTARGEGASGGVLSGVEVAASDGGGGGSEDAVSYVHSISGSRLAVVAKSGGETGETCSGDS
jgi:hypothetical protein